MNARSSITLLAAAAALFAFILLVEQPYRRLRDMPPDRRIFPGLRAADVTRLQINPANGVEIRLEKTNGVWLLTKPVTYRADPERMASLLGMLTELSSQGDIGAEELQGRPQAQSEFGFDNPPVSVTLTEQGAERHFRLGKTTPLGDRIYLQVTGAGGFQLVSTEWTALLFGRTDDWREPQILPLSALAANAIEVRSGNKNFRLELNATNRTWYLTKPLEARAADEKINLLLTKLAGIRATSFVADDPTVNMEQFGLPELNTQLPELELTFLQGTNFLGGFQMGTSPATNATLAYFSRIGRDAVFLAPREFLDPWRAPYLDFRDRHLLGISSNAITSLEISGEDRFTLQRQLKGQWEVTAPEKIPTDTTLVQETLLVLTRLEMGFESDVVTDYGTYGLTNPVMTILVQGDMTNYVTQKMERREERLSFGVGDTNKIYVQREGEARVYSINPSELELIPRVSWQMRDRQVWQFAASNVVAVTIRQVGGVRKLVRRGEDDWVLADQAQGNIVPEMLEEAMHRLGELKAVFWTAKNETNREHYGFAKQDLRLEIEVKDNRGQTEIRTLEFGGYSPFYLPYAAAVVDGDRRVFEFPWPLYFEYVRKALCILPTPLPGE